MAFQEEPVQFSEPSAVVVEGTVTVNKHMLWPQLGVFGDGWVPSRSLGRGSIAASDAHSKQADTCVLG